MASDSTSYDLLIERIQETGADFDDVRQTLASLDVELPSWSFGNAGTRFAVFGQPGLPRDVFEKLADAAEVNRHTGSASTVALHIPWDAVDDYSALRAHADRLGLRVGAINPNLFQEQEYRLGSLCHPDPEVRARAVAHVAACADVARELGGDAISLWLADGTNYAGQDSLRDRRSRLLESMRAIYGALADATDLLVEYKPHEPAFYATDIADWGSAMLLCEALGDRAKVLVDLGHHPQGVNVEQIVALLDEAGRLGGFHFNDRKYADDDVIVGSSNPFQLFLLFAELLAGRKGISTRLTIDQAPNIEPRIEAMILSVMNLQEALAKALIVDRTALRAAQLDGDVLGAHRILISAYATDVRPLCARVREELGASPDPVASFKTSGYTDRMAVERLGGTAAAWA
jgi:L-rhamnose isomerase / sugar isomerase